MDNELKNVISEIQGMYRADASTAQITMKTASALNGRFRSDVSIRDHAMTIDEPESIGGSDKGPSPIEVILAALGSCQEITYRAYASALGIAIDDISVELEGDIDFRGFFAVDESIRPGYNDIRAVVTVSSSEPPERIEQLRQAVNAHCPVLDILQNPVPVDVELKVTG